jgi:hypothetical protein
MSHRERAVDGRVHFRGASLDEYARTGPLALMAQRRGVTIPPTDRVADAEPIPAMLEDDRWVVLCPDCRRNTQLVWLETPLFYCGACFNVRVGGLWRRVALPDGPRRQRIEAIVGHRPFSHQRNWRGESLAALRRENADNGDPLPQEGA